MHDIAKLWYRLALAGYFGLFLLMMLWNTVLAPSDLFPVALVLVFSVTPMLFPLMGFLHGKPKNCSWLSYISLFYFMHGVSVAYADPNEQIYGLLEIVLSLMLFFGTVYYVRYLGKAAKT